MLLAAKTFLGAIVTMLAFAANCAASDPLRIGVSLGLTGRYAEPARMQRLGYWLWQEDTNYDGGLLGRPVLITIVDDGSDPDRAAAIYRELIAERRVDLVFGPYSSEITAAVAPVVEEFEYPTLAAGASADDVWTHGYRNVLGMWTPASRYTVGMLRLAIQDGMSRVAIASADDAFSVSVARGAERYAKFLGLDVVASTQFVKGTANLVPVARTFMAANAELVIVGGHLEESVDMRRAMKDIGWYPTAYFATVGPALGNYRVRLGGNADLSFATSIWEPIESPEYPRSAEFAREFERRHDENPSYHAATAYAAGQILRAAIGRVDSLDRARVRESLYALDERFLIGRYAVDRTGMQIKRFPLIIQWQGGHKQVVWPINPHVRTARPMYSR